MKVAAFGSFPRVGEGPENQRLRRGIQQWQAGKIDDAELQSIQEDVTREAIEIQEKAGVDWPTDGLIRWEDGQTYFADRLEGFHRGGLLRYFDTNTYYRQPEIDGDIRWTKPITVSDFEFAKAQTDRHIRPIVTGPFTLAELCLDTHYDDPKRVVADLTTALREELRALSSAGATMIQLDEPVVTRGTQDATWVRKTYETLLEGVKSHVGIALFMGPTSHLVDRFGEWPFAGVFLDCITDPKTIDRLASGGIPEELGLGLGIVDARNTRLESVEEITSPLKRVTEKIAPENIAVTTSAGLEFLPKDRARNKLERLSEAVQTFLQTA